MLVVMRPMLRVMVMRPMIWAMDVVGFWAVGMGRLQMGAAGEQRRGADRGLDGQLWLGGVTVGMEIGHVRVVVVVRKLDRKVAHVEAGLGHALLLDAKACKR